MKPNKSQCMISFLLLFTCLALQVRVAHMCVLRLNELKCECSFGKFLPTEFRPEINSLVISDSNLESLTPNDFSFFINLKSVIIDNSSIPLSDGINLLGHLKHLTNLHIMNSNVTINVTNLFSSGVNIKKLSLPENKLTHIPKGFFRNLPEVENIDLSCNQIGVVEIEAFRELRKLEDINLSDNRIGLQFDHSFLSVGPTCVYCALLPNETRCPHRAVEKCRGNRQVDDLWRMFAKRKISLEGNPLCETLSVEGAEKGQILGVTPATRRDQQDGDANRNNIASQQDSQGRESIQHLSFAPTFRTESQDGDCSFHSVGRCPRWLEERNTFLSRACHKRNKYSASAGVADPVLHPPEQKIPGGTGVNISTRDHEDNYFSVSKDKSNSQDVAEDHPPEEGERRHHGDEGKDEVGSQYEGDEQGRMQCQDKSPGEDRKPVEDSDHEEALKEQKLETAICQSLFNVTFIILIVTCINLIVLVLFIGFTVHRLKKFQHQIKEVGI